ncbi:MAG: apolipoprotein N-acyltransferase [Alphaproteobacteria bacterium 64-11]|nr:apolipoprotein N-acyltransferase [Alphaproteobacteria bacterium]OJU11199.1 MAG: apolipoprotein N-acyltransferase [Alphaproteobacteria bacterium 64-11]
MTALSAFGDAIKSLSGWRRLALGFAAGAVSATGFAPLGFFPALLLGYAALVLLIDGADAAPHPIRAAAAVGWAFLFGQFLVGFYWIGYAFMVDPGAHLWQMPFALVGLTAGLALYGALAGAFAAWFWQDGPARIFIFAAGFALCEWLRGHLLTGFPWNLSGYAWGLAPALLQTASLVGAYGLSFLTILFGAALAELFCGRWRAPAAILLLFAALLAFGAYRLAATQVRDVPGVVVRLIQPDVPQREKYVRRLMLRNWERLVDLSARPADKAIGKPSVIVWPEAATGFPVARAPGALDQIALFTARGQTVITGSERIDHDDRGLAFFNSLYLFAPYGALPLVYDKFHLVPFGEYVPFASQLGRLGITKLTQGASGFSAGDHPHLLPVPGAPPMSPLICYEVIFPGEVTDTGAPRPGWFVNVTDDSWFGPWAGPRQHLLIARVRAIEEGLPIARAANTGISAMIDPLGRISARLALGKMGVVDARLSAALPETVYARFGDLPFFLLLLGAVLVAYFLARAARRPGSR